MLWHRVMVRLYGKVKPAMKKLYRTLAIWSFMKDCPPSPGTTVITSTMSTFRIDLTSGLGSSRHPGAILEAKPSIATKH